MSDKKRRAYDTSEIPIKDRKKIGFLLKLGVRLKKICVDHNYPYLKCIRRIQKDPDYFNL